ncbi:MAG: SDR family oxidoreductase [Phycisphaerae bacterium]|nr:SDR family oxidoreductase [Phycisphaerae bacterium]
MNHSDVQIRLFLRGLLSPKTDDADRPYCPVTLTAPTDASAGDAPPLQLGAIPGDTEPAKQQIRETLASYEKRHRTMPSRINVNGTGTLEVVHTPTDPLKPLANKVVVVTGAAGAIGYGICKVLLDNGCYLAATDLPGERLDKFVEEFRSMGHERIEGVAMDVTNPASVAEAFSRIVETWGGLDALVHNAGIAHVSPLVEMKLEDFRRLERVNVEGTLLVLAEAGRCFAAQGIGGDVVLVSTKNVYSPGAGFGAYSATKAAAHQLARIASLEFAPMNVRVNMVAPDAVFSGGSHKSGLWAEVGPGRMKARGLDEQGLEEYYQNRNLLKAKVTAKHVADAVVFFLSRLTPTTGACLPIDGGLPDAVPR